METICQSLRQWSGVLGLCLEGKYRHCIEQLYMGKIKQKGVNRNTAIYYGKLKFSSNSTESNISLLPDS